MEIMIYYIIKSIIPCALGWIGCEIYHRMTKEETEGAERKSKARERTE